MNYPRTQAAEAIRHFDNPFSAKEFSRRLEGELEDYRKVLELILKASNGLPIPTILHSPIAKAQSAINKHKP